MRKLLSTLLFVSLVLGFFSFQGCEKKEDNVVKIGAILPLTGNAAWLGENAKMGIELGIDRAENKFGLNFQVVYGDSKLEPRTAISVMNKMINIDDVDFFIVSGTTIVNAVMPISEKNKKIMFVQTIHPNITLKGDYVYRLYGGGDSEWEFLAKYINNIQIKKIGTFMINAQYGIDSYNSLKKYLNNNVENLFKIEYPIGETDFRNYITKYLNDIKKIDGVVLIGYGKEFLAILKQLKEYNFNGRIFGNIDFTFSFLKNSKYAEGAIFVAPSFSIGEKTEETEVFEDNFNNTYKSESISWDIANSYDTILFIGKVINMHKDAKDNPESFYTVFSKFENFKGATGILNINSNKREIELPLNLATIKNTKVIKY